jgi:beta-lactamase regulating signal transducer with metallopeptidase domain
VDTLLDLGLRNAVGATVLALVAAGVGLVCRRPALRHTLWLLVLLRLLVPPLWDVQLLTGPIPQSDVAPEVGRFFKPSGRIENPSHEPALPLPDDPESAPAAAPDPPAPVTRTDWRPVVLVLWLAGSLLWWLLAAVRLRRFSRLLRYARPAPPALQEQARGLADRLGLARCPGVWLLPAPVSPMLWALAGRPRLLLPAALWEHLDAEQQDTLLAHELAHLRRRDHWVRRLELVVLGLYWWHPVAWWARRELHEAEEQCCDAWVVWALPSAARAYATALLETVTFLSRSRPALPATASGAGRVRPLKRRLTMILRGTPSRTLTWGGVLAVAALAALLLPLWPTWAEAPGGPPPEPEQRPPGTGLPPAEPARAAPGGQGRDNTAGTAPGKTQFVDVAGDTSLPAKGGGSSARRAEQVRELEDEIELLEAQLDVKKAEVAAAEAGMAGAKRQLDLLTAQFRAGRVSAEDMTRAQAEATRLEAQRLVKQAELKEPEVRLKQVRRRLEQLRGPAPAADAPATWVDELVDEAFKDFGPVPHGRVMVHHFRLTNRTRGKLHIASVRTSAAFVTATPSQTEADPGQPADILVRLDTGRFVGPKTARIYVTFDRPRAGEVVLQVRATSRDASEEANPTEAQKRLENLERKLNELLKEMDALKKQLGPPRPGGKGEAGKEPDALEIDHRHFMIPIQVDPARASGIREVVLYSSDDEGKSWTQAARMAPDARAFSITVASDGVYWFTVAVVDADGKQSPEDVSRAAPGLKVRVNTLSRH